MTAVSKEEYFGAIRRGDAAKLRRLLDEEPGLLRETTNPDYAPDSVNTDGSGALQNAFKSLFSHVILILCSIGAKLGWIYP